MFELIMFFTDPDPKNTLWPFVHNFIQAYIYFKCVGHVKVVFLTELLQIWNDYQFDNRLSCWSRVAENSGFFLDDFRTRFKFWDPKRGVYFFLIKL